MPESEAVDIYEYVELPKYATAIIIAQTVAVFLVVARFTTNSTPFFAAMAAGVISVIVSITWQLRHRPLFWIQIFVLAAMHGLAIYLISWPAKISFGFAFMPLAALDAFGCYKIIIAILKRFNAPSVPN